MQRVDEFRYVGNAALEQVADPATTAQQAQCMVDLNVSGQDQNADLGTLITDDLGRLQALGRVAGRHADVHHYELGCLITNQCKQPGSVASLPNHLKARTLEQASQALA